MLDRDEMHQVGDGDAKQLSLPEEPIVQQWYSIKVKGKEEYYVPRRLLTEAEMEYLCDRMTRHSEQLALHARALRSAWNREHPQGDEQT